MEKISSGKTPKHLYTVPMGKARRWQWYMRNYDELGLIHISSATVYHSNALQGKRSSCFRQVYIVALMLLMVLKAIVVLKEA